MNRLGLILCCDFLMLNHGYNSRLWGAPRTQLAGCPARRPRHVPSACKERSLPGRSRTEGHRQEEGEGGAVQLLGAKAVEKSVGHWKG